MPLKKFKIYMLGSVPMSLSELPMAPAMISSLVKRKGYDFEFIDVNLELFEHCQKDHALYQEKVEMLQNLQVDHSDPIITRWEQSIMQRVLQTNYLIVNVFSHFSQGAALRFIKQARKQDHLQIFVGGVGSQKQISGADNSYTRQWIDQNFDDCSSVIFGELLLNNGLIHSWQNDIGTSELEKLLPQRLAKHASVPDLDFGIYRLDDYHWSGPKSVPILGSHGCVRQCSFCDVIKHFPAYSFVEADTLTKQIVDVFDQTKISKFVFMDSLVNGSMKNFESLLENLCHSRQQGWLPGDFSWSGTYICRPRSSQLDRIHKLLPESGADNLVIGVETGSDRIRFDMDKKFSNQDLLYEISAFEKYGVKTSLLFFPAWPTETTTDFAETLQLFEKLSRYAQKGIVESVYLGTSGFTLIDGTPIDRDRDKIGLESGPAPFLWKCASNPDLNFWESLRRRLLMTDVCEHLGIKVSNENNFRRYILFNLRNHRNIVKSYTGKLSCDILNTASSLTKLQNRHTVTVSIVNSGTFPVQLTVDNNIYTCRPGINHIEFGVVKPYEKSITIKFEFKFSEQYQIQWSQHPSKDYYSTTGLYLEKIMVDNHDITMWGFNQITNQKLHDLGNLPQDYYQHINQRCVTQNSVLEWQIPANIGLHTWIQKHCEPQEYQERESINKRIAKELVWYL